MHGVIVEFHYREVFDRAHIEGIARDARGRFEGLPGLRQKVFTVDEQNRRATNVYLWESEDAARAFFSDELVDRVAGLYGVRPTVSFVDVAELVDNGPQISIGPT
jgi:heme-degrading monooxygenase HmoA